MHRVDTSLHLIDNHTIYNSLGFCISLPNTIFVLVYADLTRMTNREVKQVLKWSLPCGCEGIVKIHLLKKIFNLCWHKGLGTWLAIQIQLWQQLHWTLVRCFPRLGHARDHHWNSARQLLPLDHSHRDRVNQARWFVKQQFTRLCMHTRTTITLRLLCKNLPVP